MIVGLTGHARSGKDTLGQILVEQHGFTRLAFADPLKRMVAAGFDCADAIEADKERPLPWLGKSPRQLLQTLGTEWGRQHVADDVWLRVAERRMALSGGPGRHWVITDVRFDNEAQWVRRLGGQVWRLLRPQAIPVNPHPSESGVSLTLVDRTIENALSVDHLRAMAMAGLEQARRAA